LAHHAPHLNQGSDWVSQMLQHLVGMHYIKGLIIELERIHISRLELDVARAACVTLPSRLGYYGWFPVDSDHCARRDPRGKVGRDRSRAAADIQQGHP
jgi:hypothetical protein